MTNGQQRTGRLCFAGMGTARKSLGLQSNGRERER